MIELGQWWYGETNIQISITRYQDGIYLDFSEAAHRHAKEGLEGRLFVKMNGKVFSPDHTFEWDENTIPRKKAINVPKAIAKNSKPSPEETKS